jgi:hypothetical protein
MPAVGISRGGGTAREGGAHAAPEAVFPVPLDFRTTLARVNRDRFVAQGHAGGRFDANVYVTPTAKDAAFSLLGQIEAGTVLVMEEIEHGKDGSGPLLMMEKMAPGFAGTHGNWRYAVLDGKTVAAGVIGSCAGCHDEAPHDHVFPIEEERGDD